LGVVTEKRRPLAALLDEALERSGMSVDELAERTKVPRATVRAFLGSQEPAVLPQRVYLRGQLASIMRELRTDSADALEVFDAQYPSESKIEAAPDPRLPPMTMAIVAGLGGIAIIAVILAFVR
jgi:cytoskeletal protein RodZ